MTRNGKRARLPHPIRKQNHRRFENGEAAGKIAEWLHTLTEAASLRAAEFVGFTD